VTRALKRVALYRHARDQHAAYLAPAFSALHGLLSTVPHLTLAVEPGALLFEGEVVHSEVAREGSFCFRLHRDGVRSLTFCRGVDLAELLLLLDVALPAGPAARREDAVTQLWKAELKSIRWAAASGYRLDGDADGDGAGSIAESARRAHQVLDELAETVEVVTPPPLMTADERAVFDPESWADLSRSVADILARIVERGFASRDVAALAECFARLCAEMVDRREHAALLWSLRRAANLTGDAANAFRRVAGELLADPQLVARALDLSARVGSAVGDLIPVWLELLPHTAGPLAIGLIAERAGTAEAAALANAVVDRVRHCRADIEVALRAGPSHLARALLGVAAKLHPALRASLAARALGHPAVQVRLAAIPLVGADAPLAIEHLGPLLRDPEVTLRMAAADALSGCDGFAEQAAGLLADAIAAPEFSRLPREEQAALYRALGRLGTPRGLDFLSDRLAGGKRRLLARARGEQDQILAIRGLVEDGSARALGLLEDRGSLSDAVGAACRAAAAATRSRRSAA